MVCLVCLASGHIHAQSFFKNPVIPGDFADPTIIRAGDRYIATGTSSEWGPHYPIFQSKDLVNWEYVRPAFQNKPDWTKSSFWAPELYALNGNIYLYYTARRAFDGVSYIGVAITDDIRKGFKDKGCLVEFGREAIDAFVFEDKGSLYITWKAYGLDDRPIELLCSKLSPDGLRLEGKPFTLLKDEKRIGLEGQYLFKKGDYYYILYSIRSCCGPKSDYAVSAARSKTLKGPYEYCPSNPILVGNSENVLSCGHGTAVETPDHRTFYLYHAYLNGAGFYNGRQAFLKELFIDEEKWPSFVTGPEAGIWEPMPFEGIKQKNVSDFLDFFDGEILQPEWGWNFLYANPDYTLKDGTLFLTGKANDGNRYGTALCMRSLKPDYAIMTEVKDQSGICQGLTLYGDQQNLVIWGMEKGNMTLKRVQQGKEEILFLKKVEDPIHLKISITDGCHASFAWSKDQRNWEIIELSGEYQNVSYLPPWDRAFRPGLIHTGDGNIQAEFTYFQLNYQ